MRWALCVSLLALAPSVASADVDLTVPDPVADQLADDRLAHQDARRASGIALLVEGLGTSVAGAAVLGEGGERDPFLLGFGFGHAVWGLTNAVLSLFMLDLDGGGFRRIEAERALRGDPLAELREQTIRARHGSATLFAFNAALDVLYIASGVLLFFLADQLDSAYDGEVLRGYSVSQIGQGGFLLAFDVVEWVLAIADADRVAAIGRPL